MAANPRNAVCALLTPLLLLLLCAPGSPAQATGGGMMAQCSRSEYQRCVHMADPLLKDPRYIFPDNMPDIDFVCRTWSQFVACVKHYIDRCFTESRRQEFNKAVESPADSVHQMCTVPQYQNEYLKHAACIKSTLTEDSHCGRHYRHLVEQVSGEVERVSLCCSHHRFRECVLDQTARQCDNPRPGISTSGSASRFARQILDKALSFLREQCLNFSPNSGECPGLGLVGVGPSRDINNLETNAVNPRPPPAPLSPWEPRPKPSRVPGSPGSNRRGKTPPPGLGDSSGASASGSGGSGVSSMGGPGGAGVSENGGPGMGASGPGAVRSTDSGPDGSDSADTVKKQDWSIAHKLNNNQQQLQPASQSVSHGISGVSGGAPGSPWLPGRVEAVPGRTTPTPAMDGGGSTLGPARPASYGRGMSWPTSSPMPPTSRSPAADWMPNSYRVTNNGISRVSTSPPDSWLPSTLSGSDSAVNSNAVDEPNQQGLANRDWPGNRATAASAPSVAVLAATTLAAVRAFGGHQ